MAINITIKNTFLDVDTQPAAPRRRSTSVPRMFKPGGCTAGCTDDVDVSPRSDESTSASDNDDCEDFHSVISDSDTHDIAQDCSSDCVDCNDGATDSTPSGAGFNDGASDFTPSVDGFNDGASDFTPSVDGFDEDWPFDPEPPKGNSVSGDPVGKSKVTLSLVDMVAEKGTEDCCSFRSKLRTHARPFRSVREPPAEVSAIIARAAEALASGQDVEDVQVHKQGMGGTTMIVGHSHSISPEVDLIYPLVKDTLLRDAENSENTYIMGYNVRPFNNLDAHSFSFNIGYVPLNHQSTACWEAYENGFCPRCTSTCRWDHPASTDMMRVIVMIKKGI